MGDQPIEKTYDTVEANKLVAIFRRKKADGSYYYSDAEIRHWMPVIIIAGGLPASTWSSEMQRAMSELLEKAGIDLATDAGGRLMAKVYRYYERNPVNRELQVELGDLLAALKLDKQEAMSKKAAVALRSAAAPATGAHAGLQAPGGAGLSAGFSTGRKPRR